MQKKGRKKKQKKEGGNKPEKRAENINCTRKIELNNTYVDRHSRKYNSGHL